jgi:hypothetical protein
MSLRQSFLLIFFLFLTVTLHTTSRRLKGDLGLLQNEENNDFEEEVSFGKQIKDHEMKYLLVDIKYCFYIRFLILIYILEKSIEKCGWSS